MQHRLQATTRTTASIINCALDFQLHLSKTHYAEIAMLAVQTAVTQMIHHMLLEINLQK